MIYFLNQNIKIQRYCQPLDTPLERFYFLFLPVSFCNDVLMFFVWFFCMCKIFGVVFRVKTRAAVYAESGFHSGDFCCSTVQGV